MQTMQFAEITASIPWDAVATFGAGLMAVFAAWNIGRRQNGILARQTIVAENDLKIQLFERRSACLNELRRLYYLHSTNGKLEIEDIRTFQELMFAAQVLFPIEIVSRFEETFSETHGAFQKHDRSQLYFKRGENERGEKFREEAWEHDDRVFKLLPELLEGLKAETRPDVWDGVGKRA